MAPQHVVTAELQQSSETALSFQLFFLGCWSSLLLIDWLTCLCFY